MTLQDVAAAAGVSLATASRSLHNGTRVPRPELRDEVRRVAAELGYTSHGPAQALQYRLLRFMKDVTVADLVMPGRRIDVPLERVGVYKKEKPPQLGELSVVVNNS